MRVAELEELLCRPLTKMCLYVLVGGYDVCALMSALTNVASMPSELNIASNDPCSCQAQLHDHYLRVLSMGPSAATAIQHLNVELAMDVTVAGMRALGGLAALRRLSITYERLPASSFHPWAVAQLEHLSVWSVTSSGAEVVTALAAAAVPNLTSLKIVASVPLPRLVEPALAALPLSHFELDWWCAGELRHVPG